MRRYCYKIKRGFFKAEKLKKFGYDLYLPEDNSDKDVFWAKGIRVPVDSPVGKWVARGLEKIYMSGEKWKKELENEGYSFDEKGKMIINDKFLSGLVGQLCVAAVGDNAGCLFINMEGVEFYDVNVLDESVPLEIMNLVTNKVVYKKRIREK